MAELGAIGYGATAADQDTGQGPGAADAVLVILEADEAAILSAVANPHIIVGAQDGVQGPDITVSVPYFVSGVVKENDVPKRRLVRVYDRATGRLLNEEYSNAGSGRFYIVLENQVDEVYVLAFDDTGVGDDFNAQVYDLVIPKR
jgi:hypothetical protein